MAGLGSRVRFLACNRLGSRLRTWWPAEALAAEGWDAEALMVVPEPGTVDVLWVHRPTTLDHTLAIQAHQAHGCAIVVDEDDDLTALPAKHGWKPDPRILEHHHRCLGMADALSLSTDRLAEVYGPRANADADVHVLRNYLPERIGSYAAGNGPPADGLVRLGWAGITMTHRHDLEWLAPEANNLMRPPAVFTSVGDPFATQEALNLRGRVDKVHPFSFDEAEFYRAMARADVGLVPLEPNAFNEAKSWLKASEFAALGKPSVVSALPEQCFWVEQSGGGVSARTPAEFTAWGRWLVEDAAARALLGRRAKAWAIANTIERRVGQWEQLLVGLGAEKAEVWS